MDIKHHFYINKHSQDHFLGVGPKTWIGGKLGEMGGNLNASYKFDLCNFFWSVKRYVSYSRTPMAPCIAKI